MKFDPKRTLVAQSAFDFSRYFASVLGGFDVQGVPRRRPVLLPPDGMSTGGGRQARQAVALAAFDGAAPSITVGWVDVAGRRAMLRTFGCLYALHQRRFGSRPFQLDPASFSAFFEQAKQFFSSCEVKVSIEHDASASGSLPPPQPTESPTAWPIVAVGFVTFALGFVAGGLLVYYRLVWRH